MLIKTNHTVKYASLNNSERAFTGRVHAVYDDRALIRHATDPRYVMVPTHRLVVIETGRSRFAGGAA